MELKEKYCWRIIMDDSYGIGSLGKTGRGTCEYFNIPTQKVEMVTGNLTGITSADGGFCCASTSIVYHQVNSLLAATHHLLQRLNSSGYVYSASLPPLLAAASIAGNPLRHWHWNLEHSFGCFGWTARASEETQLQHRAHVQRTDWTFRIESHRVHSPVLSFIFDCQSLLETDCRTRRLFKTSSIRLVFFMISSDYFQGVGRRCAVDQSEICSREGVECSSAEHQNLSICCTFCGTVEPQSCSHQGFCKQSTWSFLISFVLLLLCTTLGYSTNCHRLARVFFPWSSNLLFGWMHH